MISLPKAGEYNSFYQPYIDQMQGQNVLERMYRQTADLNQLLGNISEEKSNTAYEQGKWTIKELVNHMNDTERVFAYRAMAIARGETQVLPGMDQDLYQANTNLGHRSFQSLLKEFETIRQSSLIFFENLTEEETLRKGVASGNSVTVRALAVMVVGHAAHHLQIIKERYL